MLGIGHGQFTKELPRQLVMSHSVPLTFLLCLVSNPVLSTPIPLPLPRPNVWETIVAATESLTSHSPKGFGFMPQLPLAAKNEPIVKIAAVSGASTSTSDTVFNIHANGLAIDVPLPNESDQGIIVSSTAQSSSSSSYSGSSSSRPVSPVNTNPTKKSKQNPIPLTSVQRPFLSNHDPTEQNIGACHILSTAVMVEDATGLSINKARLFLAHLLGNGDALGKNLDFIANERARIHASPSSSGGPVTARQVCGAGTKSNSLAAATGSFDSWEGGSLYSNLDLLKKGGAVLTPENLEWVQVESMVTSLNAARAKLISSPIPLDPTNQAAELQKAGLDALATASLDKFESEANQRLITAQMFQNFKAVPLDIHPHKSFLGIFNIPGEEGHFIEKETRELATALQTNAIYLNVDADLYVKALNGEKVTKFARAQDPGKSSSRHAVILVGVVFPQDASLMGVEHVPAAAKGPIFLIKDPNWTETLVLGANEVIRAASSAWVLKQIVPPADNVASSVASSSISRSSSVNSLLSSRHASPVANTSE